MRMNLPSDCNARMRTLWVDCKQAVSLSQPAVILSQPLCTYHNKRITYVVHSWYMGVHSTLVFKSCFAIVTIGCCSVSLMRMHWHLVPQKVKQSYTKKLRYTGIQHQPGEAIFFPMRFMPKHSMTACLIATDDVYMYTTSVNKAFSP
jgi:hypothetical protein